MPVWVALNRALRAWLREYSLKCALDEEKVQQLRDESANCILDELLCAQRVAMLIGRDNEIELTTGAVIGCAHALRVNGTLCESDYLSVVYRMFGMLEDY